MNTLSEAGAAVLVNVQLALLPGWRSTSTVVSPCSKPFVPPSRMNAPPESSLPMRTFAVPVQTMFESVQFASGVSVMSFLPKSVRFV